MIKHLLYLSVCMLFAMNLNAQTIPNNSFETWNAGPGYEDPDQWTTLNSFSSTGAPITVTKVLNAQSGSYAMQLESKTFGPSVITGTAWVGGVNGRGVPFTTRPGYFNAYTQYFPTGTDTAHIYVEFWKSGMIIGDGMVRHTSSITSYTQASGMITWYNMMSPDTVRITILASSVYAPQAGSILLVDNLTFSGAAGINDMNEVAISVYPNPANDVVRFTSPEFISNIEVYDLSGRMVDVHQVNSKEAVIGTDALTTGMYMYTVKDAKNAVINRGKLSVAK